MSKFRKKPSFIEAVQLLPTTLNPEVIQFIGEEKNYPECEIGGIDPNDGKFKMRVIRKMGSTEEPFDVVEIGDYIVRGNEEFFVYKKELFESLYVVNYPTKLITKEFLLENGYRESVVDHDNPQDSRVGYFNEKILWGGMYLCHHDDKTWGIAMKVKNEELPYLVLHGMNTTDDLSLVLRVLRCEFLEDIPKINPPFVNEMNPGFHIDVIENNILCSKGKGMLILCKEDLEAYSYKTNNLWKNKNFPKS